MASAADPSGATADEQPLAGVRVLDLTHMAAGPFCTSLLGDFGADVIKVELPGRGDALRHTDHSYPGPDGSYFLAINRNKRSLTVDLRRPEGIAIAHKLISRTHVLVENFRPGVMSELSLEYEAVRSINPAIVYCSITAFGSDGPYTRKPGMDLVVQAISGVMGLTGEPGRPPVRLAPAIADVTAALFACSGILTALRIAERSGLGQKVEVSLLEGQLSLLSNYVPHFFATGEPAGPVGGAHPQLVPYQVFSASDGYMVVACLTNRFWRALCDVLGRPELADDERFKTNPDRLRNRDELIPILQGFFNGKTVSEWLDRFSEHDVPCAPINLLKDALDNPQTRHMRSIQYLEHPVAGRIPVPADPIRMSRTPWRFERPAPRLGEHTAEILADLGYAEENIVELKRKAVV